MSKLDGTDAFLALIRKAQANATDASRKVAEQSAREFYERLKLTLKRGDPRDGHLIDSLKLIRVSPDEWRVEIGSEDQVYAAALEFGHTAPDGSRVPAIKFFFPSLKIINKRDRARARRVINKAIKETWGSR